MATLDEVSARLMKPAKDLADWNFPLAMVLEEYYTLLNEQDDVNFSNAALVLQNSVNVYMRRVEYLFHETNNLLESFVEHEAADKAKKDAIKGAKDKNALIDFGDFERIDFAKYTNKNNNMKNRMEINNSVKLLSQRFPQLENLSKTSLLIEIYDIHGEIVGKKYDFRCNEYLTASGMLVEHLTPEDFPDSLPERSTSIPKESSTHLNDSITNTESIELITETNSGFEGHGLCHDDCEDSCVVHEKETDLLDTSFASSIDSGLGSSIQSSDMRMESSFSNFPENHWEPSQSRAGSSLSNIDENSHEGGDTELLDNSQSNTTSIEDNLSVTKERNRETMEDVVSPVDYRSSDEREDTEADCSLKSTPEIEVPQIKRSKRLKNVIDAVNDLNPKLWEPIPFNGVPDKLPKSRSEFKLPCPISLLKFKEKSRKRKISTEMQKKRCLEKLLECGTPRKKMTMYSPTRQLFHPFKKEELDDLQTCFKERFKNQSNLDAFNYEAVTNISMDLLGFKTRVSKSDSINHMEKSTNDNTKNIETTECSADDFSMPDTPESSDNSLEAEILSLTPPTNYHTRIEQSIRDIYESADVRTDQEENVARWHEFMKPKLREAERRKPFDISQYGLRLIENIKARKDRKMEFKEMVNHHEPNEVARYFLASLQLANKYNIQIDTSHSVEGNFTLVLLDKDRSNNH